MKKALISIIMILLYFPIFCFELVNIPYDATDIQISPDGGHYAIFDKESGIFRICRLTDDQVIFSMNSFRMDFEWYSENEVLIAGYDNQPYIKIYDLMLNSIKEISSDIFATKIERVEDNAFLIYGRSPVFSIITLGNTIVQELFIFNLSPTGIRPNINIENYETISNLDVNLSFLSKIFINDNGVCVIGIEDYPNNLTTVTLLNAEFSTINVGRTIVPEIPENYVSSRLFMIEESQIIFQNGWIDDYHYNLDNYQIYERDLFPRLDILYSEKSIIIYSSYDNIDHQFSPELRITHSLRIETVSNRDYSCDIYNDTVYLVSSRRPK